ncbi:hypothetical protein SISNIDRAFT_457997 [Sistotremastrum niveocremeum HHB9708]|uniref:Uncharacterized protein n=1 Tax=Sistotremastrum niveocremeum HHB9708 TaxID=1314777 RepID=A0A164QZ97_9AGAM|nr:hypothetical protein SISNIDRAFT_457997 [Sistotremastrum niveocremeum HHB9708]
MLPIASHAVPKNESSSPPAPSSSDSGRSGKLLKDNTVPKPDKYNGTPDWHNLRVSCILVLNTNTISNRPSASCLTCAFLPTFVRDSVFASIICSWALTSLSANLLCVSSLDVNGMDQLLVAAENFERTEALARRRLHVASGRSRTSSRPDYRQSNPQESSVPANKSHSSDNRKDFAASEQGRRASRTPLPVPKGNAFPANKETLL